MRKFRIVRLMTGNYRVEYFETSWFCNLFRAWDSWQKAGYEKIEDAQEIFESEIRERNCKLLKNKIFEIIKTED